MNKKKILMIFIIVLIIVNITNLTIIFIRRSKNNKYTDYKVSNADISSNKLTNTVTPIDSQPNSNILETSEKNIEEITPTKETEINTVEKPSNEIIETTANEQISSAPNTKSNQKTNDKIVKNDVKKTNEETTIIENTVTTPKEEKSVPQIQEPVKTIVEETKQEIVVKPEEKNTVVEEKTVRNDAMINKIKQVIEQNATEDMKKYGYTIQVDSSITNLTNQFTFYESRVISAIRNKIGTIRIYAEDYYKNGQLIMTECYIL